MKIDYRIDLINADILGFFVYSSTFRANKHDIFLFNCHL